MYHHKQAAFAQKRDNIKIQSMTGTGFYNIIEEENSYNDLSSKGPTSNYNAKQRLSNN
jgi:hypothetical protein